MSKSKYWRENAEDTLKDLKKVDPEKATKDQFLLMGAALAILDHKDDADMVAQETRTIDDIAEKLSQADFVPSSKIDEMKIESLRHFVDYMREKGLEQTTGARVHGEYAEAALAKMLDIDCGIAEMMIKSADDRERELIRSTYKDIGKI